MKQHAINVQLPIGLTGERGTPHRDVTIGRLPLGSDAFAAMHDPESIYPTVLDAYLLRASITRFGSLKLPIPLRSLLSLDSIDMDVLNAAFDEFLLSFTEGKSVELINEHTARLIAGVEISGVTYTHVHFKGIGKDVPDPSQVGITSVSSQTELACRLLGSRIARLASCDGIHSIDGPITLDIFAKLPVFDLIGMMNAYYARFSAVPDSLIDAALDYLTIINKAQSSDSN